jgi:hypothetical protein
MPVERKFISFGSPFSSGKRVIKNLTGRPQRTLPNRATSQFLGIRVLLVRRLYESKPHNYQP